MAMSQKRIQRGELAGRVQGSRACGVSSYVYTSATRTRSEAMTLKPCGFGASVASADGINSLSVASRAFRFTPLIDVRI